MASLIEAHALLHQLSRERDESGAVVATIDDYRVVRDLVADLVADAAERSVPDTVRQTVQAVASLVADTTETTKAAVSRALGLDESAGWRRVRAAAERGFVRNLENQRGRPARLVLGDPLPEDQPVLPDATTLERLHGCSVAEGDAERDDSRRDLVGLARGIFGVELVTDEPPLPGWRADPEDVLDDDGLGPLPGIIQ